MTVVLFIAALLLLALAMVCLGTARNALTRRRYVGWIAGYFVLSFLSIQAFYFGLGSIQ